ncbi:uncharacterized [Tachysurus ichikawai]
MERSHGAWRPSLHRGILQENENSTLEEKQVNTTVYIIRQYCALEFLRSEPILRTSIWAAVGSGVHLEENEVCRPP